MRCASCGHANRAYAKFCDQCGCALAAPAGEADPRGYTPPSLAERILRARAALAGERKQVTVLFADIQGSMPLAERLGAEAWHRVLDRFFHILNAGVHRVEGTVNQYTGDGIMALFGAPLAHEDHAARACHAALDLQRQLRGFAEDLRRTSGIELAVRMGINSGEVVVGSIGDDLRMDYTAQGHTVGLAQRVEQLAAADAIWIAPATAALVADQFTLHDRGEFTLKGVSGRVRVYELGAPLPERVRLQRAAASGAARFVGRRAEREQLAGAFRDATAGHGQVVAVVGEAGVGKTRLCLELARLAAAEGATVAEAHCPAHAADVPWLALRELLRSLFEIGGDEPADASRAKVRRALLKLSPRLRDAVPCAWEFLELAVEPRPLLEDERRRETATLLCRLVQSYSARQPLVLVIDDVHCIDRDGDALLAEVIDALGWTRTLLVVNFRPGFRAPWMARAHYRELSIGPLGDAETRALVGALVGGDASTVDLRARICEHTAGNPFFAEQVVQSLIERGVLVRTPGSPRSRRTRFQLATPLPDLDIPPTVQALLSARVDRLPPEHKLVLQTAAVIGRAFAVPVLRDALAADRDGSPSGGDEAPLAAALEALVAADFIRRDGDATASEYAFSHPLTQAVAYTSQLAETRARIHLAVARALYALNADALGRCAALLAHHYAAANWRFEAARWRRRAALHVTGIELPRARRKS
jgi:class 3 adenylate cyclase